LPADAFAESVTMVVGKGSI